MKKVELERMGKWIPSKGHNPNVVPLRLIYGKVSIFCLKWGKLPAVLTFLLPVILNQLLTFPRVYPAKLKNLFFFFFLVSLGHLWPSSTRRTFTFVISPTSSNGIMYSSSLKKDELHSLDYLFFSFSRRERVWPFFALTSGSKGSGKISHCRATNYLSDILNPRKVDRYLIVPLCIQEPKWLSAKTLKETYVFFPRADNVYLAPYRRIIIQKPYNF